MTPTVGGTICELAPLGLLRAISAHGEEHYIWWEHDHGRGVIAESPFLRSLRRVKRFFTVVLGEDGMPVRKEDAKCVVSTGSATSTQPARH